jgi:uncharacterized protein (TIGR03067 family)
MNATLRIVVILVSLTSGLANRSRAEAGDLGRLQGRWTATAGTRREIGVELEIKGRDASVTIRTPTAPEFQVRGELKLNETTAPRSLDWIKLIGPDHQPLPEIVGIYQLEGDSFKVCNGGFLGVRPKEFKPGEGALADVVLFHRVKSRESKNTPSTEGPRGEALHASGKPSVQAAPRPGNPASSETTQRSAQASQNSVKGLPAPKTAATGPRSSTKR